jgi:hypothetical protein
MTKPIYTYTWQEAVDDGYLTKVLPHRWAELTGSKPLLMTAGIAESLTTAGVMEIWNEFVHWTRDTKPTLREEDQLFVADMNGQKVWVIDDGSTFTIMYPSEY